MSANIQATAPVITPAAEQPVAKTKSLSCPKWISCIFDKLSTLFSYAAAPFRWVASKFFSNATSEKVENVAAKTLLNVEEQKTDSTTTVTPPTVTVTAEQSTQEVD